MPEREFDLIVYGATGFTGRLVTEHLLTRAPAELHWAIAGRSADKLARVAAEIGAQDIPMVSADSGDPDSLAAMAASTKVVCTTVGPYAMHGTPVVEACVDAGTDYCDLTGEVQWIRQMIDTYQQRAQTSGARIVHTCGFDSIPSDIGTFYAQQQMHERHGVYARQVRCRVKAMRGGASGGTIASLVNVMEEAAGDKAVRRIVVDPYSLNPEGERHGLDTRDSFTPEYDDAFDQWVGPFVMASINTRVVRRTNALLGNRYGTDFSYEEGMLMGAGRVGAAKAGVLGAGMAGGIGAMTVGPIRKLADRFLPDAGTGPDASAREKGFFDFRLLAVHPTDESKNLIVTVTGDRDPGYGSTSKMLSEAALTLALDKATVGGGHWTPASAMGEALLQGLIDHAGLTFGVVP